MNINVPHWARDHFWEEPPEGHWEFWGFRFRPKCEIGEELVFRFDGKPVAMAIAAKIEPPGLTECYGTRRYRTKWKIFWRPESFVDLRNNIKEGKCRNQPA